MPLLTKPHKRALISALEAQDSYRQSQPRRFATYYLPHHFTYSIPECHNSLYDLMDKQRVAVEAPRTWGKSILFSVIYPLYMGLKEKHDILLISATAALAQEWVQRIRWEIEHNPKIIEDFGIQRSKERWTLEYIILNNGTRIRAKGTGYQIRGFRPDIVICDDMENDREVYSPIYRDRIKKWFWRTLYNTLEKDGQIIVIGTPLHELALLPELVIKRGWASKIIRAIETNKDNIEYSTWPDKWPIQALQERREHEGKVNFEAEYQCNPVPAEARIFKTISYYDEAPGGPFIYTGIDLAISEKETANYTSLVTIEVDSDHNIYVLEAKAGHWGVERIFDEMFLTRELYNPLLMACENVVFQRALITLAMKESRRRGINLPLEGIAPDRDKFRRILMLEGAINRGQLKIRKEQEGLRDEIITFSANALGGKWSFDRLDALAYAVKVSVPPDSPVLKKKREEPSTQERCVVQVAQRRIESEVLAGDDYLSRTEAEIMFGEGFFGD